MKDKFPNPDMHNGHSALLVFTHVRNKEVKTRGLLIEMSSFWTTTENNESQR
jgi:hypothetical protein